MNISINVGPRYPLSTLGSSNSMLLQTQVMAQMLMVMTQMMQIMTGSTGGAVPLAGNFGNSGAGLSNSNGLGNFLGGSDSGVSPGGTSASGGTGGTTAVNPGTPGAKGTGQAAVDLARKYLGRDSIGLKGDMPHFTAAGGVTNNCVDFVSSALESQGLVKGHHINVKAFEKELQKQGYRQIPAAQAQPGDVWINHSRGHTELVATAGAKTLIGSNGSARQKVSEHANNPSSGIIYSRR